jgi:hypothetical protein
MFFPEGQVRVFVYGQPVKCKAICHRMKDAGLS